MKVEEQVQALRQRQEDIIGKVFEEVRKLQNAIEDISSLLRKPQNGKSIDII
jgi:hypothetical protein